MNLDFEVELEVIIQQRVDFVHLLGYLNESHPQQTASVLPTEFDARAVAEGKNLSSQMVKKYVINSKERDFG